MIGIYNYTVILTYISLASSLFGMTRAMNGQFKMAIFCLAFSGLCDMFDGKIARSKKDRTDDEKSFGIQIDSLCDVVCFGAFPAMLCYLLGVRGAIGVGIIIFYGITSVIRLAYYNVLEGKPQEEPETIDPDAPKKPKYYHGLPITSIAVILPLAFMTEFFIPDKIFLVLLHLVLFFVGLFFVIDFKFKKPSNAQCALIVGITAAAIIVIILLTHYKVPVTHKNGLEEFIRKINESGYKIKIVPKK